MDEPLSNLDAKLRVQMRTEISRIQQRLETTTIYVTHDQTEAMTLGDRIAVMRAGVLQQVGPPSELYGHPNNLFVAGFIGSPSMNFLAGEINGDTLHLPIGDVRIPDELRRRLESGPGGGRRGVVAGLRPEHFEDAGAGRGSIEGRRRSRPRSTCSSRWARSSTPTSWSPPSRSPPSELEELAAGHRRRRPPAHPGRGPGRPRGSAPRARSSRAQEAELWFDSEHLQLFDAESGRSLLARRRATSAQLRLQPAANRRSAAPSSRACRPRRANLSARMPGAAFHGAARSGRAARLPARAPASDDRQADRAPARRARRRRRSCSPTRRSSTALGLRQRAPARARRSCRSTRSSARSTAAATSIAASVPPRVARAGAGSRSRPPPAAASRFRRSTCSQVGELYFVRDGHHRVSVARALGRTDIDAYVTEVTTRVDADRAMKLSDLPLKSHERVFFDRVPLPVEARGEIELTDPEDYALLAEMVEAWGFRAMPEPRRARSTAGRPRSCGSRPSTGRSSRCCARRASSATGRTPRPTCGSRASATGCCARTSGATRSSSRSSKARDAGDALRG